MEELLPDYSIKKLLSIYSDKLNKFNITQATNAARTCQKHTNKSKENKTFAGIKYLILGLKKSVFRLC